MELLLRLLAAVFDLSGSGGSEEARAPPSHSLADTVRCLGARIVPPPPPPAEGVLGLG